MKPLLLLCLVASLTFSCKKDKAASPDFKGIWVETSLRLDTIDVINVPSGEDWNGNHYFTLRSGAYAAPALSNFYLQPHSLPFAYYFGNDSIRIHNAFSATLNYPSYNFKWGTDYKTFTVGRFYLRNVLPASLVFERIK